MSSAAALNAALKVAHAGDTIQLAPGTYAGITASNLHFASDVTITSADPSAPATLTSLSVSASSGLTFKALDFYVLSSGGDNPFSVSTGSSGIHFDSLTVHGSVDGNLSNDHAAFLFRDSSNVSLSNSDFHDLWIGIGHLNMNGLTLSGNDFHYIRMDGIRGGGSSNVTVSDNTFTNFHPLTGEHPDAIQFWTTGTTVATQNITVSDNLMTRGGGATVQGVFIGDEAGVGYQNVKITGNGVIGEAYNGIAIGGGHNVTIDHNIVQGFTDQKSWIRVETTNGATLSNNSANVYLTPSPDTNIVMTSDATLPLASDGGAWALSQWEAAHQKAASAVGGVSLLGTSGVDTLTGGAGDDTLTSGGGLDHLIGGAGNDLYVLTGKATVIEQAGGGTDTVVADGSFSLPANVENLQFTGTTGVSGYGNELANVITGNGVGNHLFGNAGDDTIDGGGGNDQLTGGAGADHFVFAPGGGHDTIMDFGFNGEHDVLDLSAFMAKGLTPTLTDSTAGVTISYSTGESILVQGQHIANLHSTATGYVF